MRQAIGDAAGLTIKAQLRCATANLGYGTDAWRIKEAWYSRAGSWSAAALDDLRRRYATWQAREAAATAERIPGGTMDNAGRRTLGQRLDVIRAGLAELTRQVDEVAADVERLPSGSPPSS